MERILVVLYLLIIIQRLGELWLAKSNFNWMMSKGGKETGEEHYFLFILLHSLFFISLAVEFFFSTRQFTSLFVPFFIMFLILQVLRVWCITSLGRRWNTRIIVLPSEKLVSKGPYRLIKHPNYLIVFMELVVIPIMFQAYMTAVIFPVFHLALMTIRIPAENQALRE